MRSGSAAKTAIALVFALGGPWFLWTTAYESRMRSATYDEPLHIVGGVLHWTLHDYRIHPTNGPLVQQWLTLPLHLKGAKLPPLDGPEFRAATKLGEDFGKRLLFEANPVPEELLAAGRGMNAALGMFLLVAIGLATEFTFRGAVSTLAFAAACLCPNLIAHAGLATSDVGAAFGFLLATWCWAVVLQRITTTRVACSAASWGILAGIKMSAVLFLPIALIAALPTILGSRPWRIRVGQGAGWARSRGSKALLLLGLICVHLVVAWFMLWSYYGFRYSAFATYDEGKDGFSPPWEQVLDGLGAKGSVIQFARENHLLPEAYLYGFAHTLKFSQQRPAFLNGRYSQTGWWYYFPLVFLMKTPLPTLALIAVAAWLGLRTLSAPGDRRAQVKRLRVLQRAWPFLVLIVVYFVVACSSNLNIGYRHLLPILPPLFVLVGGLELARTPVRIVTWLLVAWLAIESFAARPHYLAYFNQLAGGRDQGYRRLSDSNVDWGQDLPATAAWDKERRARGDALPLYLDYFGVDDPKRFGINAVAPLSLTQAGPRGLSLDGWYCISATIMTAPSRGRPLWGDVEEQQYQEMLTVDRAGLSAAQVQQLDERLLRAKQWRLYAGLWKRNPEVNIGGSILIYRLADDDVTRLLQGPPPHR